MLGLSVFIVVLGAGARVHAQETRSKRIGSANIIATVDKFTDEKRLHVEIVGTEANRTLNVRCAVGGVGYTAAYFWYKHLSAKNDWYDVTYRFDEKPAVSATLSAATDRTFGVLGSGNAQKFVAEARQSKNVIMRVVDGLDGERAHESFNLDGLDQALKELMCQPK